MKRLYSYTHFRVLFLVLCSLLALAALIFPIALRPALYQLKVGDVSQQDIQAPRSVQYQSSILTEQARKEAEKAISPIYLQADPSIARKQIERMRVTLSYITTVRGDEFASAEQKREDIQNLQDLTASPNLANLLIDQNDIRWEAIQQETLRVLEQVMRNSIREDRVEDTRKQIPTLISFSLPEDQAALVTDLVTPFVVANSLYSESLTTEAREAARLAITPVEKSYSAGEIVIRRGQIINELTWEALQNFGLIQPADQTREIAAAVAIVTVLTAFISLYVSRRHVKELVSPRNLLIISSLFFVFLISSKLLIPNRTVIPYIFPVSAFALTIASLYTLEAGLIFSLLLSILVAYGMPHGLDLTVYYVFTSMCGLLVLGKGRRIGSFFWAGITIALTGSIIILAYRLPEAITDWIGIVTLCGAAFVHGLASITLTLVFHYVFSQVMGGTTALQMMELSRPDNPLLQYLLQNAPGTYQHSLQVANLAEQAAESIGADALLMRVGAIYHDAGKAANPSFFVENQIPGKIDTHDDLAPEVSAATIIKHVTDGVLLGRKYRLPKRLMDFMREHHGTLLTKYQYTRAVERAGSPDQVNPEAFRYPGPRPQSKETAILMLADGCEARARSELPKGEEELRAVIKKVFEYVQKEGQLDDTNLTLRDISTITESFVNTLRNAYHSRIQYPELKPTISASAQPPEIKAKHEEVL